MHTCCILFIFLLLLKTSVAKYARCMLLLSSQRYFNCTVGFPNWSQLVGREHFSQNGHKLHENSKVNIWDKKVLG